MQRIAGIVFLAVGILLIVWARSLSLRYNAWTTGFRERNPHINPPPTPEMRALNTKIMTNLFRFLGVVAFLVGLIQTLASFAPPR